MNSETLENLITWYKFTFAVCLKRDAQSLYYLEDLKYVWCSQIAFLI